MAVDLPAGAGAATDRHRRRPAWIPTVAALLTIAVCLTAANWQHRRMLEKEALQAEMSAAAAMPSVPLPASVANWSSWRFRAVTLTGEFDARHQILIDNAQHAGRVGFDVVTPFALTDGRTVLVDRGFVAGGASRSDLPAPPVPRGSTTIHGRLDIPTRRYVELGDHVAPSGPVWQHVDPQEFAQATGVRVLPILVKDMGPHADGLALDDAMPGTGIEKHISYMMQWYTFAALAGGLWVWFTARPWLRRRRRR
jgi:cytochrome oxidase assembly protein ShyY1